MVLRPRRELIVPKRELVPPHRQRGFLLNPFRFGGAAGGGIDAADFDGSNDYMRRASGMTGQADSKLGTLVFWIYPDVHSKYLFYAPGAGAGGPVIIVDIDSGVLSISCDGEVFSGIAFMQSTIAVPTTGWTCVMSSWNTGTSTGRLYFGDTDRYNAGTASWTNANIDYSAATAWEVGTAFNNTTFAVNGGLAEFWFDPTVAIDFSNAANRRLFYSALGKPVDLGADGSTPTGSAPLIYCHLNDGETANNFATNRAGKGDFTVTGALTTRATSPAD